MKVDQSQVDRFDCSVRARELLKCWLKREMAEDVLLLKWWLDVEQQKSVVLDQTQLFQTESVFLSTLWVVVYFVDLLQ